MKQIYLLYGEDLFSIEEFEKKFASEKVDPQWETFNLDILDPSSSSIDKIVESADTPPFGFGNKVTIVKNSEDIFSQKEDILEPLTNLLKKNLMETNFLIFSAQSIDKRRNFTKNLITIAEVKEFLPLKSWEITKKLNPWVEDQLRKSGKRIEQRALEELVASTGGNKHRLEREMEKLILYIGDVNIISFQDVRALVVNTESDLFEFLVFLAEKDLGNSLNQLAKILLKENAIKLVASLAANLKTIYNIKLLVEDEKNNSEIAKSLGQVPFVVEKNVKAWRNFNSKRLRIILSDLMEIDFKFKSSAIDKRLELEKFIIKNFSK